MVKINLDILEAFLECHYKAYLLYKGKIGNKTPYELLKSEQKRTAKERFKLNSFKNLNSLEFDCEIQSGDYVLKFDALETVVTQGASKRRYIPLIIIPEEKFSANQKLLAISVSILVTRVNFHSDAAKIIYGRRQKVSRISVKNYNRKITRLLSDLVSVLSNKEQPKSFQNKHCQVCEFQGFCNSEMLERDDLSLLGGITHKQIESLNNKGIFTVNQLSYTYRPRRRKKIATEAPKWVYPLKALALREQRTFIVHCPSIPSSKTEIFLDIEGLPEENFYYLIGLIIRDNDGIKKISLWADSQEEEFRIFKALLDTIQKLCDFRIFHYGSYEIQALKKISAKYKQLSHLTPNAIANSTNLLSLFRGEIYLPIRQNGLKDVAKFLARLCLLRI